MSENLKEMLQAKYRELSQMNASWEELPPDKSTSSAELRQRFDQLRSLKADIGHSKSFEINNNQDANAMRIFEEYCEENNSLEVIFLMNIYFCA